MLTVLLYTTFQICRHTLDFYIAFLYYYWARYPIKHCPTLHDHVAKVHVFTLAKQLHLWDAPHYRAASFAEDLRLNLKNVAIPGTGVPLSIFCYSRSTALLFLLIINPIACLVGAAFLVWQDLGSSSNGRSSRQQGLAATYAELLLAPQHWFAIWRHNCLLVGWHALATGSTSYRLEDKGTFLLEADRLGLAVSPFFREATVFVKHKSIEGGMGIHVFRNFTQGGDWIIQKALSNSAELASLLPADAPLSTLRVVTASIAWLEQGGAEQQHVHGSDSPSAANGSPMWRHRMQQEQHQGLASDQQAEQHKGSPLRPQRNMQSSVPPAASNGRAVPRPGAAYKPRPATPPLPVSAGVMRCLNTDGRSGQFADAVTSLRQQGMADPVLRPDSSAHSSSVQPLLPKFGLWGQHLQWQHHQHGQQQPGRATSSQAQQQLETAEAEAAAASACAVVTAVWRAGRAGAATDHSSVCFNVDTQCGVLGPGVTANHWYQLGPAGVGRVDAAASQVWSSHPDSCKQVAGCEIPGLPDVLDAVLAAHMVAAPDLPLVGWDVALTAEGIFILEANLSCNLFNGAFDREGYYSLLYQYLMVLNKQGRDAWMPNLGKKTVG